MKDSVQLFILIIFCISFSQCKKDDLIPIGQIITPSGEMLFILYDDTPHHRDHFIQLAEEDYWDTLTFNRVIENFVIQGGCPDTPEGFSDLPYLIKPEFVDTIKHIYGALGAGRDNNPEKLSAGCQLYVVQNKEGLPRLDGDYMIFGQMIKGFEVLDNIARMETDSLDKPLVPVSMDVNVVWKTQAEVYQITTSSQKQ